MKGRAERMAKMGYVRGKFGGMMASWDNHL